MPCLSGWHDPDAIVGAAALHAGGCSGRDLMARQGIVTQIAAMGAIAVRETNSTG